MWHTQLAANCSSMKEIPGYSAQFMVWVAHPEENGWGQCVFTHQLFLNFRPDSCSIGLWVIARESLMLALNLKPQMGNWKSERALTLTWKRLE